MPTPQAPDSPERLAWPREIAPEYEPPLLGGPAIAAWFARVGFVTREGLPPTVRTLKRWKQERRLPVTVAPVGVAWTTTAMLAAWCLSAEARALAPRDAEGKFTRQVRLAGRVRQVQAVAAPPEPGA
jgi:hypothetical protein